MTCEACKGAEAGPMAALLWCPFCNIQHIDEGEWATRPHHTHLCHACGEKWRVEPYFYGVEAPPQAACNSQCRIRCSNPIHTEVCAQGDRQCVSPRCDGTGPAHKPQAAEAGSEL